MSIVFPGQENVTANGAPSQPQFTGGALTSLAQAAQPNGGTVTYSFTASKPGTFLYESGGGQKTSGTPSLYSSPQVQVRMGLFGALIVRPAGHPDWVYGRADSQFNPNTEFLVLLSEIDPYLNAKVLKGTAAFNMNTYKPRYWLINGRQFPDSIADNFASWLPSQPYGSLATIHPKDASNPWPAVDRYLSVGTVDYPFHPHGNNGKVIGRDGTPLAAGAGEDMSFDKFSVNIGPGQTWDVLFDWKDNEDYSPANPVPVTYPDLQNLTIGAFYSGSPYLGVQEAHAAGRPDAQRVRRVLHHRPQPRALPDHVLGREHDRADHLHAGRSARAEHLSGMRGRDDMRLDRTMKRTFLSTLVLAPALLLAALLVPAGAAAAGPITSTACVDGGTDRHLQPVGQDRHASRARQLGHDLGLSPTPRAIPRRCPGPSWSPTRATWSPST